MTEWREVKLGDVCRFQNGFAFKSSLFINDGNINVIKIKEIKDGKIVFLNTSASVKNDQIYKKYQANNGDVLIALTGDPVARTNPASWVGRVAIYREYYPSLINQRVAKFLPDTAILYPNFVYYFFREFNNFFNLAKKATGSASQANISTNTLMETRILLPPLDVQKKIAGVLGALDDKIELNNKINQNLEAQAQALFKSWFIDFEPFGGKMPDDWKIGKLSDIAEYSNDTISTEFTSFENYISTENMLPNRGGISRASSLPTSNTVKSYRTTDVLISNIRPYFKKIWFALFSGGCSNDILVFRSKKDSPAFVFNVLNQDDFFEYVMSGANGSKMPRGDKKHIMQYKVIIPSAKTIKEFENIAITFLEKFSNNNQENVHLAELRDTLLPKLMNGEIDVDNVKID